MITTLWVIVVGGIVALAGTLAGRSTVSAARNRIQSERAFWTALGCARRAQAAIDDLLRVSPTIDEDALIWRTLERRLAMPRPTPAAPCELTLEAAGTKLDVNAASEQMVTALLETLGVSSGVASSMAESLADWRDVDEVPRSDGAERDWYQLNQRMRPRNGPLADVKELALVRGFDSFSLVDVVFTAEPGRISLAHASATILQSVPGFTPETAQLIAALASAGTPVRDAAAVMSSLTPQSASALMANYPEIVRVTTADPDAWLLDVRVANGEPRTTVVLRWRLIRAGDRCVVAASRTMV